MFDFNIFNIKNSAKTSMTRLEFFEAEIKKFKKSQKRKDMITGENYYNGVQDILNRKREIIGEDGSLVEVTNLPNNKIVDNQYAKMVDQKTNYLLGKPITFKTENTSYADQLDLIFNKKLQRTLNNLGECTFNGGIAYLYPYYNDNGDIAFKIFYPSEGLPFWKDQEHTELDCFVRIYQVEAYEGAREVLIEKVEIYTVDGIERYELRENKLIPDVENPSSTHLIIEDNEGKETGLNWEKVPVVAFKYNNKEIPLIKRVKCLQDGINTIISDFQNNMQEDARNTILILKNYDGTNLGEFRRNLAQFGAVKVKTVDGADGSVDTLNIVVNAENYKAILDIFKKALIENARGYDAKDERMNNNPNQMNIQSMYSDIDLDANGMETEWQASFEELLWFINIHLSNTGKGDFTKEKLDIIFNRDVLINETEAITNCKDSMGVISNETIVSQHPWINDNVEELKRIKEEKQDEIMDLYNQSLNNPPGGDNHVGEE